MARTFEAASKKVIGCAIEVHRELGPGLLESTYEHCLARELSLAGLPFRRQVPLPVHYKGAKLDCGYRIDFVIGGSLLVELKIVDQLNPVHQAQILTYLKLSGIRVGLLINFNVEVLRDGIKRYVV